MSAFHPFCNDVSLYVKGRIAEEDALRQERTARDILERLAAQPGVILADEVGMGKTFVALAVAVSVALVNRGKRPVVVMVPSSLKEKWPADFALLREKCLPDELRERVLGGQAERAVDFLKLLDDPAELAERLRPLRRVHGCMGRDGRHLGAGRSSGGRYGVGRRGHRPAGGWRRLRHPWPV